MPARRWTRRWPDWFRPEFERRAVCLARLLRFPLRKTAALRPVSPYLAPGFYDDALAHGRHREIVGGRWDETGRVQMALLQAEGLQPRHRLLDIGAGSLRLGCKAVPFLDAGNYWATDASLPLMQRGRDVELPDPLRLPPGQLVADSSFDLPGVPDNIDYAIAFGVFTHLPQDHLSRALVNISKRLPHLRALLFTVFLAPDAIFATALRQPDGVVTHPDRAPWHFRGPDVLALCTRAGLTAEHRPDRLPRGQVLFVARLANQ